MDLRVRLGIGDEHLLRALRGMEENLELPLSREELASLAAVSLRHLDRMFRTQLGRGVHEHYLGLRLSRAKQLLRETSLSVLQVSVATGFGSPSQFSRAFKRVFRIARADLGSTQRHRVAISAVA